MDKSVVVDASVFIEYWRSKKKENTLYAKLVSERRDLCVSAVAKYEVLIGAAGKNLDEWRQIFDKIVVVAFDDSTIMTARKIYHQLKHDNKMIGICDILIAATAVANELPLATLNRNHFEHVQGLKLAK